MFYGFFSAALDSTGFVLAEIPFSLKA